jgi:hypothetical protein
VFVVDPKTETYNGWKP